MFKTKLSAGTNPPVGVYADTVVTAASFPQGAGQTALIVAYRLGANGKLPAPKTTTAPPPAKKQPAKKKPPTSSSTVKLAPKGDQDGRLHQ